jgi:hypothetical protein
MTALGQVAAGARITAAMLRAVSPNAAYKGSNQSVVSSTTVVNDNALFVPVLANGVYLFEAFISYSGFTRGVSDLKMNWAAPSGSVLNWMPMFLNTSGTLVAAGGNGLGAVIQAGTNGVSNNFTVTGLGTLSVGSTAGNMQLQWAQNTSSTTATMVQAGSLLALWQVQ